MIRQRTLRAKRSVIRQRTLRAKRLRGELKAVKFRRREGGVWLCVNQWAPLKRRAPQVAQNIDRHQVEGRCNKYVSLFVCSSSNAMNTSPVSSL
eukprot:5050764-Pyramimonas_sp.AAC.1